MNQTDHSLRWYALRTKSRYEEQVRDRLAGLGWKPLLLTVKRVSQWKDRKKVIQVPLFSGYCVARFSLRKTLAVLKVEDVVDVVGNGNKPEPIPGKESESLRTLMTSMLSYDPSPYLGEGMAWRWSEGLCKASRASCYRKTDAIGL